MRILALVVIGAAAAVAGCGIGEDDAGAGPAGPGSGGAGHGASGSHGGSGGHAGNGSHGGSGGHAGSGSQGGSGGHAGSGSHGGSGGYAGSGSHGGSGGVGGSGQGCAPGYTADGDACVWTGVVHDGEFLHPPAWHVAGGAVVDPAGGRDDHAGEARIAGADLCAPWSIAQNFALPPIDSTEPLVLRYASRSTMPRGGGSSPGRATARIAIGGVPILVDWLQCGWNEHAICLGEGAHAGSGGITFSEGRPPHGCEAEYSDVIQIDGIVIEPAPDLCPAPGMVRDPGFDDPGAWHTTGGASVAGGVATLASPCDRSSVEGKISIPLAPSALEFEVDGTADAWLSLELSGSPAGSVRGTGQPSTGRICLPAWSAGHVLDASFVTAPLPGDCSIPRPANFQLDDLTIVSDPSCGTAPDGTFETTIAGFDLVYTPGAQLTRTVDPARVRTGTAALAFDAFEGCTGARASFVAPIPSMQGGTAGPALRYWYRIEAGSAVDVQPGMRLPVGPGIWVQRLLCLDGNKAGELEQFDLELRTVAVPCDPLATTARAEIDDVEIVLDGHCNGTPDPVHEGQYDGTPPTPNQRPVMCDPPPIDLLDP